VAAGILVFKTIDEAVKAGFHVIDRLEDGYLVRSRVENHWVLAVVKN
jgi:hypothetical protein